MADSLIVDWLNENQFRSYPLKETANRVSGGFTLADDVIVDASLIYNSAQTSVSLISLTVAGPTATFLVTGSKSFVVTLANPFPQYMRLADGSLLVVSDKVLDIAAGTYSFTNCDFEESVYYEFHSTWLGVSEINFNRVKISNVSFTNATLDGAINLVQGLQFNLDVAGQNLVMGADRNFGIPLDCTIYGPGSSDCDDLISSINGVGPDQNHVLNFVAGNNVLILDDPANNRIYIGLTFDNNDLCPVIYSNPIAEMGAI